MQRTSISDEELVSQIASLCLEGRRLVARLIVHLIEVEDRALDKKSACSSMWAFCIERLGMSEGETSRRLNAAKLVRRFPSVLGRLERGDVHLSGLRQLAPYLTAENVEEILDEAKRKTKSQLEEMIARRFPRPDAPTVEIPVMASIATASLGGATPPPGGEVACPTRIEPLSATGVLVQMTMTAEGYADLKRAKELVGHCIPDGDTVKVIERALRTLVADLELDHIQPRALGGGDDVSNLRVRCRAHNLHAAEEIFGKEHVAARIHGRQQQRTRREGEKRREARSSAGSDVVDLATRGLLNMGFGASEVKKTLLALASHRDAGAPPLPELLREAIAALT